MENEQLLENMDLNEENKILKQLRIKHKRALCGCAEKHFYGNYINPVLCEENCLCDDCVGEIDRLETLISSQEIMTISIEISKNSATIIAIKDILDKTIAEKEKIQKIKELFKNE